MNHNPILKMSRCAHVVFAALLTCVVGNVCSFAASDTRYYVNDHLATTVGIADAAGEIAALEADAFGSPLAGASNADRFTGKPYDEDLGAYVFPFRNYRADEARWMSADPSGFPDGVNGIRAAWRPFAELDPLGLAIVVANDPGGVIKAAIDRIATSSMGRDPNSAFSQLHTSLEVTVVVSGGTVNEHDKGNVTINPTANTLYPIMDDSGAQTQTIASLEQILVHELTHARDFRFHHDQYQSWKNQSDSIWRNELERRAVEEENRWNAIAGTPLRNRYGME